MTAAAHRHAGALYILAALVSVFAISGCASDSTTRPARSDSNRAVGAQADVEIVAGPRPIGEATVAEALHEYYQKWQGVPYRYGGTDENGIDCSSFVRQTLDSVESLELPRTTEAQVRRGERIDRDALSPGDLVFFKTGGGYRHVGVYVSRGRFMHASSSAGVTMSRLNNAYWRRRYWQSRRVTPGLR